MDISVVAGLALVLSSCVQPYAEDTGLRFQVAVVDRFYPGDDYYPDEQDRHQQTWMNGYVDLDRDRRREPFYHGDIVSILAAHPSIAVLPYVMQQGRQPQEEIIRRLKDIRKHVFWGEPIHALVLSWESSTLISAFEKPLRKENVDQYKEQVRLWGMTNPVWRLSYQTIRLLEDIAEVGVKVFTIAGNGGRGMVNTYSFAKGVTTVGATEHELRNFVSDNVFVDIRARAAYQPSLVSDGRGMPKGYDFDGDNCSDVPVECLTGYQPDRLEYPHRPWPMLKGSSFAAPIAMKQVLLRQADLGQPSLRQATLGQPTLEEPISRQTDMNQADINLEWGITKLVTQVADNNTRNCD